MGLPYYEFEVGKSSMIFDFVSEGVKGKIPKLVKISETGLHDVFNLAFGDKNEITGDFNDAVISNNGDSEKVLTTIVATVYFFTDQNPNAWIYAEGSTRSRTRLYRMGITKHLHKVNLDFVLLGLVNEEWEVFHKERDYEAFLAKRKSSSFEKRSTT